MRYLLIAAVFLLFSAPAFADSAQSIEQRAEALKAKQSGVDNYHAYLASNLADIAMTEKFQNDNEVAKRFMLMAEEHAAMVGGKK